MSIFNEYTTNESITLCKTENIMLNYETNFFMSLFFYRSKKESVNGNGNTNSSSSNSSNSSNGTNSKEAWPSLGSSPPSDSPARKQNSPKPHIG